MSKKNKKKKNVMFTVRIPTEKEKDFKRYVNSIKGFLVYNNNKNNLPKDTSLLEEPEEDKEQTNELIIDIEKTEKSVDDEDTKEILLDDILNQVKKIEDNPQDEESVEDILEETDDIPKFFTNRHNKFSDDMPQKSFLHYFGEDDSDIRENELSHTEEKGNHQSDSIVLSPDNPHWIHDTVKDEAYANGYKILRSCVCSVCGHHSNNAKTICPHCETKMK